MCDPPRDRKKLKARPTQIRFWDGIPPDGRGSSPSVAPAPAAAERSSDRPLASELRPAARSELGDELKVGIWLTGSK